MKTKRPQLYPTRHLKGGVDFCFKLLDRVPLMKRLIRNEDDKPSDIPVSVLMPIHYKDLWIAEHSISFLRRNLQHPIAEIVVVSARHEKIQEWCDHEGLRWLDEAEILDWTVAEIGEALPDWATSRDGWLFQQLLKLSVNEFCVADSILILDADTLLLKKMAFHLNGAVRLDYSHERNLLYLQTYEALLGKKPSSWMSFVTHHILMEKSVLKAMKEKIEQHSGKAWDQAIIDFASSDIWSEKQKEIYPFNYFSEYEIYGNFRKSYEGKVRSRYFWNYSCRNFKADSLDVEEFVSSLPSVYSWVSFHSYNRID